MKITQAAWLLALLSTGAHAAVTLDDYLQPMQRFSADFAQTVYSEDGQVIQRAQGHFKLQRPGRLLWHTTLPEEHVMVADGQWLWSYDPELAQVIQQSLTAVLAQSPAVLLMQADFKADEFFSISPQSADTCSADTAACFQLQPKSESLFSGLWLGFDAQHHLQYLRMDDHLGHQSHVTFSHSELNAEIAEHYFEWTTPVDVDVVVAP